MKRNIINILSVSLLLALFASSASAEVVLAKTRTAPWIYGGAEYTIRFGGPGDSGTYQFVTTIPNARLVILFNAEAMCQGNTDNWVDVDILVNPAGAAGEFAVPPTNGDNAFVSGNTTASNILYDSGEGWVSAAIVATTVIATPGTHTIRVEVDGAHSSLSRFDDMSLVVMQEKHIYPRGFTLRE